MSKYDIKIKEAHVNLLTIPLILSGITFVTTDLQFASIVFVCSVVLLNILKYYSDLKHNHIAMIGFYIYNGIAVTLHVLQNHQYISSFSSHAIGLILFLTLTVVCQPIVRSIAISKAIDYAEKTNGK